MDKEMVMKAIDDEPEYPGEMPDEMWEAIKNDKDAVTMALRLTVRLTKCGIKVRLGEGAGQISTDPRPA